MLKKLFLPSLAMISVISLMGCEREVELKSGFHFTGLREVVRTSIYSNTIQGKERVGTQIKLYTEEDVVGSGDDMSYTRRFVNRNNSGYLSKTLPSEMAYMTPIKVETKSGKMFAVEGFNDFAKVVVPNLHLPVRYEKELTRPGLAAKFATELKEEWDLSHILHGAVPLKSNVTHLIPQKKFGMLTVDSVVSVRVEEIGDIDCLRYEVHYQKPLPANDLIYEQMRALMKPEGKEYDVFQFKEAVGHGVLLVWRDVNSSRVCKTSLNERQINTIEHKETKETQEVESHRFTEVIYTYPEAK